MSLLKWEDPPEPTRRGRPSKFRPMVEELRLNVGQWARLANYQDTTGSAHTMAKKLRKQYPDCEFVARRGAVYGRARSEP